ncbi:MAG: hypothetical protein CVV64_16030 [Candidatus Wallbacteria bacterium HGW-Wallbacteria-1]|uniref:Helix-hairpin-helix DNA-binding motif class 1 domain-containing protein n=1 Tax=Candidatus Wallbacteria bacterium HGW-Wallbacteria-1 TaxID=2013854 RepID=A0A2N1PL48_9BACT|nr:MAG: hypothetical protein CVV64_16030 [Candidatus Wallbacteria bacterium HGW-Wallbacteria-1]
MRTLVLIVFPAFVQILISLIIFLPPVLCSELPASNESIQAVKDMNASSNYVFLVSASDSGNDQVTAGERNRPLLKAIGTEDEFLASLGKSSVNMAGEWKKLNSLLSCGMGHHTINIGRMARNYAVASNSPGAPDGVQNRPLYIHLKWGGNMPKRGFYLVIEKTAGTSNEVIMLPEEPYIEMPPKAGLFEGIFAHEHGHLIDSLFEKQNETQGWVPERLPHTTPAITDFQTAFTEGWGNHFEAVTDDLSDSSAMEQRFGTLSLKGRAYFMQLMDLATISQSFKRGSWMRQGLFAFRRVNAELNALPAGNCIDQHMFARAWTEPSFNLSMLKNGQQMLSCEGLCATLFYRLATDKAIQENYLDPEFYWPFLNEQKKISEKEVRERVSPLENGYLKLIHARALTFRKIIETSVRQPDEHPVHTAAFIETACSEFPSDRKNLILHFLETTMLSTCRPDALDIYSSWEAKAREIMSDPGSANDGIRAAFSAISSDLERLSKDSSTICKFLGQPLWLENDMFKFESKMGFSLERLSINLNAAEEYELMTIPGISFETAARITNFIRKNGPLKKLDDLQILHLSDALYNQLDQMVKLHAKLKK